MPEVSGRFCDVDVDIDVQSCIDMERWNFLLGRSVNVRQKWSTLSIIETRGIRVYSNLPTPVAFYLPYH